jgi:diguanylate cyclase (GGDEF)-like protein
MPPPPKLPDSETSRLATLRSYEILDTAPEESFDDLTRIASQICGCPIALVSLIDKDRQWFKSRIGLDVQEMPREQAFCAHAILNPTEMLEVGDAASDARFADNPLVTGEPKIRFYAGVPLVTDHDEALGTLCVIDGTPRSLSDEQRRALKALSRHVMRLIEMRRAAEDSKDNNESLQRYQTQLETYQRQLEQSNVRLRVVSSTDPLTGLNNRTVLRAELESRFEEFQRHGKVFSVLMLDVDHLKGVNETYGHPAGDEVLKQVAALLRRGARGRDVVGRYGGEEFAVLLDDADVSAACVVAERCRKNVESAHWSKRGITVSVGAATSTRRHSSPDALLAEAERALHVSKRSGRNRVSHAMDLAAASVA